MSESAEASGPSIHQETDSESEDDFDPEEIEKEILGVRSMLRRHCGRHKVLTKSYDLIYKTGAPINPNNDLLFSNNSSMQTLA